jgi:hypothetical protein
MTEDEIRGPANVTAWLRKLADEVDDGTLNVGAARFELSDDASAAIEGRPDREQRDEPFVLVVRVTSPGRLRGPAALEQELAHPGG